MDVKDWITHLFIKAIENGSTQQDRMDMIAWFTLAREKLADDTLSPFEKFIALYRMMDFKKTIGTVLNSVSETVKNYSNADLPLALKVTLPVTLAAATLIGGQSVGIAGFGSAVGMPALLLIFIGVAGITAILQALLHDENAKDYISVIVLFIAQDEIMRRVKKELKEAMLAEPIAPKKQNLSKDAIHLKQQLLSMNPYDFEQHIMSFFQAQGLLAWVTKKSNDAGVDGFARHPNGLIVVQCKRNGEDNLVGSPIIQQFKGVIEENNAWRGYIVTTSYFTKNAIASASKNDKLKLIDMTELLNWHLEKASTDNSKEENELREAYELGFLSAEDYKRKSDNKTLSKKQLQQLEELEKAHKAGFLSDNDFAKRRKIILSAS